MIVAPAIGCIYLSRVLVGRKFIPRREIKTTPNMVAIVTIPNTEVTRITPPTLLFAAGYIKIGMRDSQGPRIKIVNKTQGVKFFFSREWTCA
jgi:hypothetical protein